MLSPSQRVLAGFQRFGFGPRPGDLVAVSDPRAALHAELASPDAGLIASDATLAAGLQGTAGSTQTMFQAAQARKTAEALGAQAGRAAAVPMGRSQAAANAAAARLTSLKPQIDAEARLFRNEALLRLQQACTARVGFVERLVVFWSNHFCISVSKGEVERAIAGPFEREAIRPHVLGRFADMLAAVEQHPAMLTYLDNAQSVGRNAHGNRSGKRGLNENLAREILELHTLGVEGGYGQSDVTAFARVLTGWTVAGHDGRLGDPGSFAFDSNLHEPGTAIVLGQDIPAGGFGQGEAVLAALATHPATARHIATKLARYFLADAPPQAAVDRLAAVFTRTEGDLRAVSLALVDLPESWTLPPTKMRTPYEFVIAAHRWLGRTISEPWTTIGSLKQLGMPLWEPSGPNGFPDVSAAWATAEGLKLRLDWCAQLAHGLHDDRGPDAMLADAFGADVSLDTRLAIAGAESREQAVALLLMSPEFQRR